MKFKSLIIFALLIAGIFLGIFYIKVELSTSLNLKQFDNVEVPAEVTDYTYRKIFNLSSQNAKLLFRLSNSDLVYIFYTRPKNQPTDPTDIKEFGPWEFERLEFIRQKSKDIRGWTFPPYF